MHLQIKLTKYRRFHADRLHFSFVKWKHHHLFFMTNLHLERKNIRNDNEIAKRVRYQVLSFANTAEKENSGQENVSYTLIPYN